jgi:hypothetical protein
VADKPLICIVSSVRSILAGTKTQSRRVVKGWPNSGTSDWQLLGFHDGIAAFRSSGERLEVRCPCPIGTRLWVRETWRPWSWREDGAIRIQFCADGAIGVCDVDDEDWYCRIAEEATLRCEKIGLPRDEEGCYHWPAQENPLPWKPGLFLPRAGSRITLEVTDVRVQRVQDISEDDALAEGVEPCYWGCYDFSYSAMPAPLANYRRLWDEINAKRGFGWAVNPWVWAYTFRVLEAKR